MNANNQLKKGIVNVFIANVINLVISLLINFLLPKYLSVDAYAAIKTYHLYVAYAGVLSLGYVDGMFLKYGGTNFKDLDYKDLNCNLSSFRIFQTVIVIIMTVIVLVFKDPILLAFSISTLPLNMAGYFRSLYQSIGEFKRYSKIMNATAGASFAINMFLLFIVGTDNYMFYLFSYVLLNIIIWAILEYYLKKSSTYKFKVLMFSTKEIINNVKDGILLMMGNFSNIILTSMDRWFIKVLLDTLAFAQYSFACSMENFVNVAVTPITVTLYNYFCRINDNEQIKKIRNVVMLFSSALIACAFPGKFILQIYLTQYLEASSVMFFLFAAQLFYIINKSIYVNLYKARHCQKKYFIKLVIVIIMGFIFNVLCYALIHKKESFAMGTLLSAILWLILSVRDFPEINFEKKEIAYIIISIVAFISCGYMLGAILGLAIYLLVITIAAITLMKEDFMYLFQMLFKFIPTKKNEI